MSGMSRRNLLKALGLGAAALGVPSTLRSTAKAQEVIPQRLLIVYYTAGFEYANAHPADIGGGPPPETGWQLPDPYAPVAAYQDRMNTFLGLSMVSHKEDPSSARNSHVAGMTHALTGAFRADSVRSQGPSIDQAIGRALIDSGVQTRFPVMNTCVSARGSNLYPEGSGFFGLDGSPLSPTNRVDELYERYFPADVRAAAMDDGSAARATRRRGAVADLVRSDLQSLVSRLSSNEREKVSQHLDTFNDLQSRVGVVGGSRGANIPDPSIVQPWLDSQNVSDSEERRIAAWDAGAELCPQLVAGALHADLTRVATIRVGRPRPGQFNYDAAEFGGDREHGLQHRVDNDPRELAKLLEMQHLSTNVLKRSLDELASRREPDGQSLLDHTLVLFATEIGYGTHNNQFLPWATFGDAHGQLVTGRCLNLGRHRDGASVPYEDWSQWNQRGRAHNDLFVSIAQAMGLDWDTFGESSVCNGRIDELHR